jgi:hypothetical protein
LECAMHMNSTPILECAIGIGMLMIDRVWARTLRGYKSCKPSTVVVVET